VKWVDGQPVDIQGEIPDKTFGYATSINDYGEIYCTTKHPGNGGQRYVCVSENKPTFDVGRYTRILNGGSIDDIIVVLSRPNWRLSNVTLENMLNQEYSGKWSKVLKFVDANECGEVIVEATTFYGEKHIMLVTFPGGGN
jgi:hypothetical protein